MEEIQWLSEKAQQAIQRAREVNPTIAGKVTVAHWELAVAVEWTSEGKRYGPMGLRVAIDDANLTSIVERYVLTACDQVFA